MRYELRLARESDHGGLIELIELSSRTLGAADYSARQIEGALKGVFGLDTRLITDRTYYVAVAERAGAAESVIVACGGWSFRKTLFGGDTGPGRDPEPLDPAVGAAKIRAFFVHPDHARRGLGSLILDRCEAAAAERGFLRCELMATLTGQRLYAARGYRAAEPIEHELAPGLEITFVPMEKQLSGILPRL